MTHRGGFTVVELVVIITVIGILATIGLLGWRNWQLGLAKDAVRSDLQQAATAMTHAKNIDGAGYPTALPSTYKPGSHVTVTYVSGDSEQFCIEGRSTIVTSVVYFVNSVGDSEPQPGTC